MDPEALEKAARGSLAEGDVRAVVVDGSAVLRLRDGHLPLMVLDGALGASGMLTLAAGGVLLAFGRSGAAGYALGAGAMLLALFTVLFFALVALTMRPPLEFRPRERAVVWQDVSLPFAEIRPDHLVLRERSLYLQVLLRHPALSRRLAAFSTRERRRAAEFHRLLTEMVSAPDLTPTQRWILGAAAPYGLPHDLPVDRLGTAADRDRAHALLADPWNVDDLDQLLPAVNWLVQDGHRAAFAQDAELAARPDAEREEYARLLREIDVMIAEERMEPPFVERLVELVRVRYGAAGETYARLVPGLLRDEPGADVSPEGAELAVFFGSLFNDRDHAAEELGRLKLLADDPSLRATVGRLLIWDYARALTLYRLGRMADWLTEGYCWDRMLPLAIDVQRRYASWDDLATCYLQGRLLWSGGEDQRRHETAVERLRADPDGPWARVPWDLPLERDWS
ncbi:hypothetical protein GCM10009678_89820 [Actinomadura kijaniata]|uniref:DUF1266 domain-containing protein n=1 Tax=Actinomadura namibiensis TaxID=182080 RepID=A0A7W3QQE4_ACTNM|nr:DUF1266 domain-containing protein [Actinomadura namibiensis]MBA8955557.1 hypothetical protein [Actinomadura namibiensis]